VYYLTYVLTNTYVHTIITLITLTVQMITEQLFFDMYLSRNLIDSLLFSHVLFQSSG